MSKVKNYTIYFEICGKKLKTSIPAYTEDKAVEYLRSKVKVHKVEESELPSGDFKELLDLLDKFLK